MTNNQMFLALLATLITLLGAFYKVLKDYIAIGKLIERIAQKEVQ